MGHIDPDMQRWLMARTNSTAIDSATELFTCRCGKTTCHMHRLRPFREHIKRLCRAIAVAHQLELLTSRDPEVDWDAILSRSRWRRASEDASADTAYVDDSESIVWCDTAWEFEELSSEIAAKYVAGPSIFNFLWCAHEAAVGAAGGGQFKRDKVAVRGRRLAQGNPRPEDEFPTVTGLYRFAELCRRKCGDLDSEIDRIAHDYKLAGSPPRPTCAHLLKSHCART